MLKKENEDNTNGRIYHARGMEELISFKHPYYPAIYRFNEQITLKFIWNHKSNPDKGHNWRYHSPDFKLTTEQYATGTMKQNRN